MNEEQKAIAEEIFYMFDQEHIAPVEALNAMAALLQELIDAPEQAAVVPDELPTKEMTAAFSKAILLQQSEQSK